MRRFVSTIFCLLAATVAATASIPAFAAEVEVGDLTISGAFARATPPNAPTAAAYLTITNHGDTADLLTGASADFAESVQIHEVIMEGDVMNMRELSRGLEIPPGETVMLAPGGYHVMFMGIDGPLVVGETRHLTLSFEHAGDVDLVLDVQKVDLSGPDGLNQEGMDHEGMDPGSMDPGSMDPGSMGGAQPGAMQMPASGG